METLCITKSIKDRVLKMFEERFKLELSSFSQSFCDEELLSMYFGLKARDLIYLYFDIENEFSISIPEEDIVSGKFNTLNNIINIVQMQVDRKNSTAET